MTDLLTTPPSLETDIMLCLDMWQPSPRSLRAQMVRSCLFKAMVDLCVRLNFTSMPLCVEAFRPEQPTQTIEVQLISSSDDAEERLSDGRIGLKSSDLELGSDNGIDQVVGLRFRGVEVPNGASVVHAYVQFTVDELGSQPTTLIIELEASDHAEVFTREAGNLSSRFRTTSSVIWRPERWGAVSEREPAKGLLTSPDSSKKS